MLVELGLVEQRDQAVLEVLGDGASVTDVALRYGVARRTVHDWLRKYAAEGLRGLADRSSRPLSCPHQVAPVVEARIVEMRRAHPGWGATHDLALAPARRCGVVAGAHVGGAVPGASWARLSPAPAAEALGLQTLGAQPGDGAVADGHRGWGLVSRDRCERSMRGRSDASLGTQQDAGVGEAAILSS
jgi:hypothetical protein